MLELFLCCISPQKLLLVLDDLVEKSVLIVIFGEDFVEVSCQFHCTLGTIIDYLHCTNDLVCGIVVNTLVLTVYLSGQELLHK